MTLIEHYTAIVSSRFPEWGVPDRSSNVFVPLFELSDILTPILDDAIKAQQGCAPIISTIPTAILSTSRLSQGSVTAVFISDIVAGLLNDTKEWAALWVTIKATAVTAGSSSGVYTPILTNQGLNGIGFSQYFQALIPTTYRGSQSITAMVDAFVNLLTELYTKYLTAGPGPGYLAITTLP